VTSVMAADMDLARMNYMASQVIASGVVLQWNFHANRRRIFSIRLADSPESTRENSP
jgi:hypothetical protein